MIMLRGSKVSDKIKAEVSEKLSERDGYQPTLAIVRVGDKPDDMSYERSAVKKMEAYGLCTKLYTYPEDISGDDFIWNFKKINEDDEIDGILLLRPLPKTIDEGCVERTIDPRKDVDGISPENIAKVTMGDRDGYAPCTAQAVIEMLKAYDIEIRGKRVVIIGRSLVIGKPLSMLMLGEDATVTICHSKTVGLREVTREADILVAAIGKARMIDASYVKQDAIVIDVGINVDADGKLCGDVDTESLEGVAAMVTPVPGGLGAVTTSVLAKHLIQTK